MAGNLDGWVVVDDRDPSIQYDEGLWRPVKIGPTNGAGIDTTYNGSVMQPVIRGGMSFKFNGGDGRVLASVAAATARNITDQIIMNSMFSWECFIDGQPVDSGALSDIEKGQNNYELCRWRGLSIAERTLTVNVSTQEWAFGIDRIEYVPAARGGYTIVDPLSPRISTDAFRNETSREVRMNVNGSKMTIEDPTLPNSSATYQVDGGDPVSFDVAGGSGIEATGLQLFETPTRTSGAHTLTVTYTGSQARMPLVVSSLIVQEDPNAPTSFPSSPPSPSPDDSGSSSAGVSRNTTSSVATSVTGSGGTKIPLAPIVGAVAGGVAVLLVIIIILCLRLRKKKRAARPTTFEFFEGSQSAVLHQHTREPHLQPPAAYRHGWYDSGTASSQATSTQAILTYPEGIQIIPARILSPTPTRESHSDNPVVHSQSEQHFVAGSSRNRPPVFHPEGLYAKSSRETVPTPPLNEKLAESPVSRPPESRVVSDLPKKQLQDPQPTVRNPHPTSIYHRDGGVQILSSDDPPPLPVREYPPEYGSVVWSP
ncbi:hypothetical protein NLJ89_g4003 [Agrocybe chaxingu]|uniref:Uncharacterized protein n=1 Tax=Agrocybe chaxingu TaxID=84603 RepID=A0A9W8KAA4_9AGAR|nr:hypothetical protein NLJ89_g4003 [Agrocybe chaxingu]